jgi:hypothetical protein
VIVLIVDNFGIGASKLKCNAPIATNPNGPNALPRPFERMQPKARKPHVLRLGSCVQATQDQTQSFCVLSLNPGLGSCLEKFGRALMLEASDHDTQCNL